MHRTYNRRTAMCVKGGAVKRSNRHQLSGLRGYTLDRRSPVRGYNHVVTKRDVQAFIDLIPDWSDLSRKIERIVLASSDDCDGEYVTYKDDLSTILLYAWPSDLWTELSLRYFEDHWWLLEELKVVNDAPVGDAVLCRFNRDQARAFMLLHVFLHELGHHHDRLVRAADRSTSGEEYAERFANERFHAMYPDSCRVFGDPAAVR